MLLRHRIAVAVLAGCLVLLPQARGAEGSWAGRRILVKQGGVRLNRTPGGDKAEYVATLTDLEYTVDKDEGGWLELRHRGVAGWLPKGEAVLTEEAVAYFTDRIRHDPKDALA